MRNNVTKHRQQGFTFIEVIVAVSILVIVGMASAMLLRESLSQSQLLQSRDQRLAELKLGLARLRADLEQAAPRYYRDRFGSRQPPFITGGSVVADFIRAGKYVFPTQKPVTVERVRYQLKGRQLVRQVSKVLDGSLPEQWQEVVLLDDIADLHTGYYFADHWQSAWTQAGNKPDQLFPLAFKISFNYQPFGQIEQKILLSGGHND